LRSLPAVEMTIGIVGMTMDMAVEMTENVISTEGRNLKHSVEMTMVQYEKELSNGAA
jgi:hypothetical protein